MLLKSYAKVNLFLKVLSRRPDGYHNIETLFERIDLCDRITLRPLTGKQIRVISNDPAVPSDKTNLCFRAAALLQEKFKVDKGVQINIKKNIPVAAGLAGGSSNAAQVILGLNRLWRLGLSRKELTRLGLEIGSDVPFFIYDSRFAVGSGRGEEIKPEASLKDTKLWHILAVPALKVPTPKIYALWDKKRRFSRLTPDRLDVKILLLALRKKSRFLSAVPLYNSLEQLTCGLYPQVMRVKDRLLKLGVKSILMSGSGPAVFGIVASRKEAAGIARKLKRLDPELRVFVAGTR